MSEIPEEATEAAVEAVMAARHLGSPHSRLWARRILADALPAAAPAIRAAERERLLPRVEAAATTLVRPGNGPAQWDEVVVVPLDRLRELLDGTP